MYGIPDSPRPEPVSWPTGPGGGSLDGPRYERSIRRVAGTRIPGLHRVLELLDLGLDPARSVDSAPVIGPRHSRKLGGRRRVDLELRLTGAGPHRDDPVLHPRWSSGAIISRARASRGRMALALRSRPTTRLPTRSGRSAAPARRCLLGTGSVAAEALTSALSRGADHDHDDPPRGSPAQWARSGEVGGGEMQRVRCASRPLSSPSTSVTAPGRSRSSRRLAKLGLPAPSSASRSTRGGTRWPDPLVRSDQTAVIRGTASWL